MWRRLTIAAILVLGGTTWKPALAFQPGAGEVARIAEMNGEAQRDALRDLLRSRTCVGPSSCANSVFLFEASLRPALRALLDDSSVTEQARQLLSMIGEPEDLRLLVRLQDPPSAGYPERWRYHVAAALLDPDDETEWSFLQSCAVGQFGDLWVQSGSIQTLRRIASPRSRAILEEARKVNLRQASSIDAAIRYIDSAPAPLAGADLEALSKRITEMLGYTAQRSTGVPRFNMTRDKALVDLDFLSSDEELIYTATFHKIDGVWAFRGAWETLQAAVSIVH